MKVIDDAIAALKKESHRLGELPPTEIRPEDAIAKVERGIRAIYMLAKSHGVTVDEKEMESIHRRVALWRRVTSREIQERTVDVIMADPRILYGRVVTPKKSRN